jgi:MerR family transcriptional regulator/heat shock protein HspR
MVTKMKRKQGFFSISAVAKMLSVHQQTIRLYEKEGLLSPKRSEGNTRLFSEEDVDRLEEIIYLTHQLGINLAGVDMIFKLKKQISKMQKDMNQIFDQTQSDLDRQTESSKEIVSSSMKQLMSMKQEQKKEPSHKTNEAEQQLDVENWEIEYDND